MWVALRAYASRQSGADRYAGRGAEVVMLGRLGGGEIRLAELARWADTIPYEILCAQRIRLPRIHLGIAGAGAEIRDAVR